MKKNISIHQYNLVAQILHWTMAGLLLYLILFSHFEDVPDSEMVNKIQLHAGLGTLVCILGIFRWHWRQSHPRPTPPDMGETAKKGLKIVHTSFYALFLLSPAVGFVLAGLVAYPVRIFGLVEISGWLPDNAQVAELMNSVHGFSSDLIVALLSIHVVAALYHQFITREDILSKMLPIGLLKSNSKNPMAPPHKTMTSIATEEELLKFHTPDTDVSDKRNDFN